jgi:hypothetical protein
MAADPQCGDGPAGSRPYVARLIRRLLRIEDVRPLLLTAAIVLMAIAASDRQPPAPASFGGYVVADATGAPLAGARVTFSGPALRVAVTDANGLFAIPHLPPGEYAVEVGGRSIPVEVTGGVNVRDLRV